MTPAELSVAVAQPPGLLLFIAGMLAMGLSLTTAQILQPSLILIPTARRLGARGGASACLNCTRRR